MAERRMFAKTIIDSDVFLDMPLSSQALYFHLSMRADDDGFINNPKKIQRMIGASDDDLRLLEAKSFIIRFETGVIVIKHWRINNYIQKDRYKPTVYTEEKDMLSVKDNGSYTACIQNGYNLDTQYSIGKVSIEKDSNNILSSSQDNSTPPYDEIINYLNEKTGQHYKSTTEATRKSINGRLKEGYTVDDFKKVIDIKTSQWLKDKEMSMYLRPSTLFSPSKFESYLNEATKNQPASKYNDLSERIRRSNDEQFNGNADTAGFR
jgi:uncharacterized phage protein (TIGR02220 family)